MLLESYLGVSVHSFKAVSTLFTDQTSNISQPYQPLISSTKSMLEMSEKKSVKERTEELIQRFKD